MTKEFKNIERLPLEGEPKKGWESFFASCNIIESFDSVIHLGSGRKRFVVFPTGDFVMTYHGNHTYEVMKDIKKKGWSKVLDELKYEELLYWDARD